MCVTVLVQGNLVRLQFDYFLGQIRIGRICTHKKNIGKSKFSSNFELLLFSTSTTSSTLLMMENLRCLSQHKKYKQNLLRNSMENVHEFHIRVLVFLGIIDRSTSQRSMVDEPSGHTSNTISFMYKITVYMGHQTMLKLTLTTISRKLANSTTSSSSFECVSLFQLKCHTINAPLPVHVHTRRHKTMYNPYHAMASSSSVRDNCVQMELVTWLTTRCSNFAASV